MSYGGDPANSNTDAVRALLRDTSTSAPLLTDNEVSWLVADYPSVHYAAAAGADMIAGGKTESVTLKRVGDLTLQKGGSKVGIAMEYRSLAKQLRLTAATRGVKPYTGGISIADKDSIEGDTDWDRPAAKIGMHDYDTASTGAHH